MNFELSDEQIAMRDMARDLLAERWDKAKVRAALGRSFAVAPDELWTELADMGWLGVACSEIFGGSEQDTLTAAILSQEAGRALLPGLLDITLAASIALNRCNDTAIQQEYLPGLIAGRSKCTLAFEENNGSWGPENIRMEAALADNGLSLSGVKILVPSGTQANFFLVAFRHEDNLCLAPVPADAPGLTITPMPRFDAEDMAELNFDKVIVPQDKILRDMDGSHGLVQDVYAIATLFLAASLLGNAEALLHMTTEYAKERVQFGRPIGSFQAVSHRLADVLVNVEIGRSLLYGACLSLDEKRGDAYALVSAAKSWLNETAIEAAEAALQLHGGIGYTWEMDIHLYLRRARSNAVAFGDSDHHRDCIARNLFNSSTVSKDGKTPHFRF